MWEMLRDLAVVLVVFGVLCWIAPRRPGRGRTD